MHITKFKKQPWKDYIMIPTIWQIRQNYKDGKKTRGYQEGGMDRFSIDDFWGSETSTWYYNDGYMLLYVCQNIWTVQNQIFTLYFIKYISQPP